MNKLQQIKSIIDYQNEIIKRWIDRHLKRIFSDSIKANFMIDIFWRVFDKMGNEIPQYFNQNITVEELLKGNYEECSTEICKNIVNIHRANMIFVKNRKEIEEDENYKNELVNDVITQVKLRQFSGRLFRNKQIIKGDNFIYFPVPYTLFAICVKSIWLLDRTSDYRDLYTNIFNKTLSALSLLESSFLDSIYPICRSVIELLVKLLICKANKCCLKKHNDFVWYEINRNCCGKPLPKEFNDLFNKRKNKQCKNRIEYLHFGWVDDIPNYHNLVKNKPYSIEGLMNYCNSTIKNNGEFGFIYQLYQRCHIYAHGNVGNIRFSLLHYFETTLMMYYVIHITYSYFCNEINDDTKINNIDVIKYLGKHLNRLGKQYSERSTPNFEHYYKNPK